MSTPIGSASITVQAVTDAFQRSLGADTDRVLDSLQRNFDRTWDNLRHTVDNNTDLMVVTFNQASAEIQQTMRDTAQSIERSFDRAADRSADRMEAAFQQAARDMAASFERASQQSTDSVDRALTEIRMEMQRTTIVIQQDADEAGDAIGNEITEGVAQANLALALLRDGSNRALGAVGGLGRAFSGLAGEGRGAFAGLIGAVDGLGSSLLGAAGRGVSAFSSLSKAAVAASLGVAAFVQVAVGAVAAIEQLAGVALVAPAAILSFAAVTKTLGLALKGVSDTLGAALSGDTVTFAKEMGKLQPAAQQAIFGLNGVLEGLRGVGGVIQQNFFENLSGPMLRFGEAAEEVARKKLQPFATVMGNMAAAILDTATKSNLFAGVSAVLDKTIAGVAGLEGPLSRLAPAFGSLFGVGAGFIDRMYASLGNLIDRFTTFVITSAGDGRMEMWIENALAGFRQLGRILGNLGSIFTSISFNAGQAGTGILDILERVTQAIDEALGSDQGQAFLIASFGLLAQVMDSLLIVAGPLLELFAVFATIMATRLTTALQNLEPFLRSVAELIGKFADTLPGVNDRVNEVTKSGLTFLLDTLKGIAQAVPGVVVQVVDLATTGFGFLAEKAGLLASVMAPIGGLLEDFAFNLRGITDGFDEAFLDDLITGIGELGVGLTAGALDAIDSLALAFAALAREIPRVLPILGEIAEVLGSVLGAALDATVPLFEPLVDILEELTPALDFVDNALGGTAQALGIMALAILPIVQAFAKLATMTAQSLNPAVTALRITFTQISPGLQRISELLGGALTNAFMGLKPGLDAIVNGFVGLLPLVRQFGPPLEELVLAIKPLIELVGRLAGESAERLAPALFKIIEAGIKFDLLIAKSVVPVIADLIKILTEELEPAFHTLLDVVSGVMDGIATATVKMYEILGPILATFADVLAVVLPAAIDSAKVAIKVAWDAIVLIVETAWDIISGVFIVIVRFLSGDFEGAWRALKEMIVDVFEGIWDFIVQTINNIIDFFTSDSLGRLATAVGKMFGAAWSKVVEWMSNIWNAVTGVIEDVIQWFKDLPGKIKDALVTAGDFLFEIGKDIVKGLINGLIDAATNIKDVVNDNIIKPVKGFFQDAFDFGSPSKVTKRWGGWIGDGFAIGIRDAEAQVVAAAEALTMAAALPGIEMTGGTAGSPGTMAPFAPVTSGGASMPVSTGSLFGPGSIQVVFSGVVPSESQAYATGQAVGSGIADELARRDARLAVGTL